jgi:Na+-driven multidrug efflux pump
MVSVQSFNGAGDTRTPTVVNLLAYWFIQLPLAAFMAWPLEMASDGIFWAVAAAQFALAAIAVSLFRRGRWKNVHV